MGYYIKAEPGVKLYINDVNPLGKKTILFIHGWPLSSRMFEYQLNVLPELGFRCIGVDCRGFGKSDKPWEGYDYNRLADDILSVVLTLRLQNFVLASHSTGGAIAIRYMARYKGYGVSKLALFAAAAPSLIKRPYFPYGLDKEAVDNIIKGTYNDRPNMLRGFGNMLFYQETTEPFKDWLFQLGLQAASWSTAAIAKSWLDEERLFTDLEKINVPTLILHSIHDRVCLFPLAEAQHTGIKNSKLVPFDNSGHALFWEERLKFNNELVKFIGY